MDKIKKPKRTSTYEMLKTLDKKVQKGNGDKKDSSNPSDERRRRRSESPRNRDFFRQSFKKAPEKTTKDETNHDIPDRSYGDLYCKACDSHMNSEQMWEAHIQGKRHQKHVKKGEGDNKYETIDEDPIILPQIKNPKETLIGLDHCCEIQRYDGQPIYQCFLCSSNLPNAKQFIEHIVGLKHRMAYLKEHDPVKHNLISKTDLKKGMIEPVVADCIIMHSEKYGPGHMQVKKEKKPPGNSFSNLKRTFNDDYEPRKKRDDRSNSFPDRHDDHDWRRSPDRGSDRFYPGIDSYDRRNFFSSDVSDGNRNWAPVDYPYRDEPRRPFSPPPMPGLSYSNRMDTSLTSSSSWGPLNAISQESRANLQESQFAYEKNKALEKNLSSNSNMFQSILTVIDKMPSVFFLEIVLRRLENLNPSEAELSLLQKIGNHMISIVMNKKLQNLSPDLLNKYQQSVSARPEIPTETSNAEKSNFGNLMNMIDQIKSSSPINASPWNCEPGPNPGRDGPAFTTQTNDPFYDSWQSPASSGIPGLTLSSEPEQSPSPWSTSYPSRSSYPRY